MEPRTERILEEIRLLYADATATPQETLAELQEVQEEVEIRIDAITTDIRTGT